MPISPHLIRPEVWQFYQAQLATLDQTDSLVRGVGAIAWQVNSDWHPDQSLRQLDDIASTVIRPLTSRAPTAVLAHLHEELFATLGFRGDPENYYQPQMSYLPLVLERRRGLPVLLTLVYKAVAERVGLVVEGVNTPGHFLAAVMADGSATTDWQLIDPFAGGRLLSTAEAAEQLSRVLGQSIQLTWDELPLAAHPQWLGRILLNLWTVFQQTGEERQRQVIEAFLRPLQVVPRD
ncbi:MAG: transglutaminase-like domain-containing protein [Pirellulales bacterium]|nr:transglutaminase-like domain-containing protein [Pirellulales bacterium]